MVEQADRFCVKCGVMAPPGQLDFAWDVHLTPPEMTLARRIGGTPFMTCSRECRAALGLAERKLWPDPKPPDVEGW